MAKPRILLAAPKSGSGKTLITCSLLSALLARGKKVKAFKSGPDYIDPMFHKKIIGVPSKNLDLFFADSDTVREIFLRENDSDISVIEGAMGLYDGVGGITDEASAYHLAKTLCAPIILVIDARGMGRSILAEISGFLAMDKEHLIKGVILNKTSGMFYQTIKSVIEHELDIAVLGYFPVQKDIVFESRYLGLKLPDEIEDIKEKVKKAGCELEKSVDIDKILEIAECAPNLIDERAIESAIALDKEGPVFRKLREQALLAGKKIAVARDEAFCFYYEDNLAALEASGATLEFFSPLRDEKIPQGVDAILFGGGYPELFAKQLSENTSILEDIYRISKTNVRIIAECGGFMYLHDAIIVDKVKYKMAGVIGGECEKTDRLVRFGYVSIEEKQENFLEKGAMIKGHEFHYYDSTSNGESCIATKPVTGRRWDCIHETHNLFAGFEHLYYLPDGPKLFA